MLGRTYGQIKEEMNLGMGDARGDGRGNRTYRRRGKSHEAFDVWQHVD